MTFVLVQILPGLTLPQQRIDFRHRKRIREAQEKTALFIGLEVGSFESFVVVDLELLATQTEKRGSACQLGWGSCRKGRSTSRLLVARVVLIVAAVAIPVLHVVVVIVVIVEEV